MNTTIVYVVSSGYSYGDVGIFSSIEKAHAVLPDVAWSNPQEGITRWPDGGEWHVTIEAVVVDAEGEFVWR